MNESTGIASMTGFGRATNEENGIGLSAEIRTVNHRFLDMRLRLPSELASLELEVRQRIQATLERGRVELFVQTEKNQTGELLPTLQRQVAQRYIAIYQELALLTKQGTQHPEPSDLVRLPGVVVDRSTPAEDSQTTYTSLLWQTLQQALAQLVQMRRQEGQQIAQQLHDHLDAFEAMFARIREIAPTLPQLHFQRLQERLKQFSLDKEIDTERIAQEVALFADRCDVTEEIARLSSHIQQFREALTNGGAIGRRLDFLCQELLRETNTISAKNAEASLTTSLISMKTTIEKLREQVQNIE